MRARHSGAPCLCHTPVRDGAAKGKVERFFRTVRMSFLSRALDLSSLCALNRDFTRWVEDDYNGREHSAIHMRPHRSLRPGAHAHRSRKISVRFDRKRPSRVVVYYKGERMGEARPLDLLANDRAPRTSDEREVTP